jgi:hypothetical protein
VRSNNTRVVCLELSGEGPTPTRRASEGSVFAPDAAISRASLEAIFEPRKAPKDTEPEEAD